MHFTTKIMIEKSPLERKCVNCARPTSKGIYCRTCDVIWFIADRIEGYHADPILRLAFIEDLKRKNIFTPAAITKEGENLNARKMKILGHQLTGFCIGFVFDEITNLLSRGYNLAKIRTGAEIERIEKQSAAFQAGRQEVEKLHQKIRQESKIVLGHLKDGIERNSYRGFDPAATDENETDLF